MTTEYTRSILRVVVAQICQTVGWHSINSHPYEFLVDLMQEYILRISKLTHGYAEVYGRTEANLEDLGLAFQHLNIDIQELVEYVQNVDSVPCIVQVPKLPIHKENHLNFLKPGSSEVVTRPVHVHEHLPAMYPEAESLDDPAKIQVDNVGEGSSEVANSNGTHPPTNSLETSLNNVSPQCVFKRPNDVVSFDNPLMKRMKAPGETRPLREIHSVIMTTSGFISPAREGKLPEARTPQQTCSDSPPPSSYPMVPPELKSDKKPKKIVKKTPDGRKLDKENKKKKGAKDLFKPDKVTKQGKSKKSATPKETKAMMRKLDDGLLAGPSSTPKLVQTSPKTKAAQKNKVVEMPSMNMMNMQQLPESKEDVIDKLPFEPDKQKLHIFKKISKPREDKDKEPDFEQHKPKEMDSVDSVIGSVINQRLHHNDVDVRKEEKSILQTPSGHLQFDSEFMELHRTFPPHDASPFVLPVAGKAKTSARSNPPMMDPKKRKRERVTKKREPKPKIPKDSTNSKKFKPNDDPIEIFGSIDVTERPKPLQGPDVFAMKEPPMHPKQFPFMPYPPAPGLIPHPLFSQFPQPFMPMPHPAMTGSHPGMSNLPLPPGFPLALAKNMIPPAVIPGPHAMMPNPPAPSPSRSPIAVNPVMKLEDIQMHVTKSTEKTFAEPTSFMDLSLPMVTITKVEKEKDKVPLLPPLIKTEQREYSMPMVPSPFMSPPVMPTVAPPTMASPTPAPQPVVVPQMQPPPYPMAPATHQFSHLAKALKAEKPEKKSKEHKKEKKDKTKKKKEKKDKHKEKGEKTKEKKEKGEKKEKLEKIKEKKEKKEKRKEKDPNKKISKKEKEADSALKLTLKLSTPAAPAPLTPEAAPTKKITIKPITKKPEEEVTKREPSPELAKISALVTRPPKPKSTKMKADVATKKVETKEDKENGGKVTTAPAVTVDTSGRQVWICPACGNQDDGSPMIGCDDCDAWYHWVCVGMQVPPANDENWYCRFCLAKNQEQQHHDKKKKKSKKKKEKLSA